MPGSSSGVGSDMPRDTGDMRSSGDPGYGSNQPASAEPMTADPDPRNDDPALLQR